MEEGVVILHPVLLVVYSPPWPSIFFIAGSIGGVTKDNTVAPREGQLVHLAVARSTDARIYKADNKDSQSPQIIQIYEVSILGWGDIGRSRSGRICWRHSGGGELCDDAHEGGVAGPIRFIGHGRPREVKGVQSDDGGL